MAISSIHAGTNAAALQKTRTDESDQVQSSKIPDHAQASEKARDAVQLAKSHANTATEPREVTAAKAALNHVPEISEERRAQIVDRLRTGYYNQPDVLEQVADKMTDALQAGKKDGV